MSPDKTLPVYSEAIGSQPVDTGLPIIDTLSLNTSDPFERTVWELVTTYRAKRHDYTEAGESPWSNFDHTEGQVGMGHNAAVAYEIVKKEKRLKALASRGGSMNESALDTLADLAVYNIIRLARTLYPSGAVNG